MGTFAHLYNPTESKIPEEKYDEVHDRMKTLITRMGSMKIQDNNLYGKHFYTLSFPEYDERDNIALGYNYFEEDEWEWSGYNGREHEVVSRKIGQFYYNACVLAIYTLESLYLEGPTLLIENEFINEVPYVSIINGLFHEHYRIKNEDPWQMIVTLHDDPKKRGYLEERYFRSWPSEYYGTGHYGVAQQVALIEGTEEAARYLDDHEEYLTESSKGENIRRARRLLEEYFDKAENKSEEAFRIAELFNKVLETVKDFSNGIEIDKSRLECLTDQKLADVFIDMSFYPAVLIKAISEIFNVDFWDLYELIREYMKNPSYLRLVNPESPSAPIQDVLYALGDEDFIPYFRIYDDIELKEETLEELKSYRDKLDEIRKDFTLPDNTLKWMVEVIDSLGKSYPSLPLFNTFFEDSLENIKDENFMAIWKLLEDEFVSHSGESYSRWSEEHRRFKLLSGALGNRTVRKDIFGF